MRRLAALVAVMAATGAVAALPPGPQRAAELRALLDSPAVAEALGRAPIVSLEWLGPDRYRVRSAACTVEVGIRDDPSPAPPGPRRFHLDVGRPVCP